MYRRYSGIQKSIIKYQSVFSVFLHLLFVTLLIYSVQYAILYHTDLIIFQNPNCAIPRKMYRNVWKWHFRFLRDDNCNAVQSHR